MKVRSGFVSNSSSSSFVVAVKDKTKTKVTINFEVDLKDYADEAISTIKELNKYFDNEYGDREWMYEECRAAIEDGKTILLGSFCDDSGNGAETFLCDNGLKGNVDEDKVEILQSEGGY